MSPVWLSSCRGPWLDVGPVKDSGSNLPPWSTQDQVHPDLQRTWLRLTPSEVPGFDQVIYFPAISSVPEILSSISCNVMVILAFVVPVCLLRFSTSRIPSVCGFFLFSFWSVFQAAFASPV